MGVKMRKCHVFFLSNTDESLHIRQISAMQMLSFRLRTPILPIQISKHLKGERTASGKPRHIFRIRFFNLKNISILSFYNFCFII